MSSDQAYPLGQRCWFPHDVEGYVSGDLIERTVEGEKVTLKFKDDADRVRGIVLAEIHSDETIGACLPHYFNGSQQSGD